MKLFHRKMNLLQIMIGFLVLFFGSLVYIVDRPPDKTYWISRFLPEISLHHILPNLFGVLGNSLADFCHVFAWIMITAGILSCGMRGTFAISGLWLFIDSLFEIGQKFSETAVNMTPEWFQAIPLLKNTPRFFQTGTFDWLDLAAILMGSAAAIPALRITTSLQKQHCRKTLVNKTDDQP
jgi:hypothetical protein